MLQTNGTHLGAKYGQYMISYAIMPLVINTLRGGHTYKHTDIADKSNFKKLGMHWPNG